MEAVWVKNVKVETRLGLLCLCCDDVFFSSAGRPLDGTVLLHFTCTNCLKVSWHGRNRQQLSYFCRCSGLKATSAPWNVLTDVETHFQCQTLTFTLFFYPSVSTQTEAVLLESMSDSIAMMLYVTVRNIKVTFDSSNRDWNVVYSHTNWVFYLDIVDNMCLSLVQLGDSDSLHHVDLYTKM